MFEARSTGPRHGGEGLNHLPGGTRVHLALYKTDRCPFCVGVHRVIDELGVSVAYRDNGAERRWREEQRALTGRNTVPCLVIDGRPNFESREIAACRRERFGAR